MNNQEMATGPATTDGSTDSSTVGSTIDSSGRFVLPRWTREENLLIQKLSVRNAFVLASRHGKVDEFLRQYFPNRTKQAVWQKLWQVEKQNTKFCKECGSKLK